MDSHTLFLLALGTLFCLYMAWNIGANDVANAMGTSVGSKALTLKGAIIVAIIFEFSGALFFGGRVTDTIRKDMIDPLIFQEVPLHLLYGMLSALLASAIWLNIATKFGYPVSTTHSIVGAVVGFGLIAGGFSAISWSTLVTIVLSWVVSPLSGGIMAFIVFRFVQKKIINAEDPMLALKIYVPILVMIVITIITLALLYEGLKNINLELSFPTAFTWSLIAGLCVALFAKQRINKIIDERSSLALERFNIIEYIMKYLQILTACYVAFAHGSNDVANAVGPFAAVVSIATTGTIVVKSYVPVWILMLGGFGIVLGLATYGYKVIETIGNKITELTPSRGFSAEFAAATTVLICSKMGIPISTTHTLVGAVVGVGLARGLSALDFRVVRNIFSSWFITLPATMVISIIIYLVMVNLF